MIIRQTVVDAVGQVLTREAGDAVEASFIYGSVAVGTATDRSDLDCFVLLKEEPSAALVARLHTVFTDLQRELGFVPDPQHPVETFSVLASVTALDGPLVVRALYSAARGDDLDPMTLDSDGLEILRAMLNVRVPVVDSVVLDGLTSLARHRVSFAASLCDVAASWVAGRVGVKRLADAPTGGAPLGSPRMIALEPFGRLDTQQRQAQYQHG